MIIDYIKTFPIPEEQLPRMLHNLLTPIRSMDPDLMIEITKRIGVNSEECCYMAMAAVPEDRLDCLKKIEIDDPLVAYSVPICDIKGELSDHHHSLYGFDYLVAAWGNGSFYTYNLSEKVWMTLGLSQRCIGNNAQKVVYDDLSVPVRTVLEGHLSNEFCWKQNRDVVWKMRNDYLRQYLWMKGQVGIRFFYYESKIDDTPEIRVLMDGESHYIKDLEEGWCKLSIKMHLGKLLLQVWAKTIAIYPEKCIEPNKYKLVWPGDNEYMTEIRMNETAYPLIFLRDDFLKKYEEDNIYKSAPIVSLDGFCYCNPSYKGQWCFVNFRRIGRNIITVPVYDLYKNLPDKEILHLHGYAISPEYAATFDDKEENIVMRTNRFIKELIRFGELLQCLSYRLELDEKTVEAYIGFVPEKIRSNGWGDYPIICKLSRAAPLNMSESDFLNRCKTVNECLAKIKSGSLRKFLEVAGAFDADSKKFGNLKLLQSLKNILDHLIEEHESVLAWFGAGESCDWKKGNSTVSALFVNNELRIADAHESIDKCIDNLERLGFDSARLSSGYGTALDFIFDAVIESIRSINNAISRVLLN